MSVWSTIQGFSLLVPTHLSYFLLLFLVLLLFGVLLPHQEAVADRKRERIFYSDNNISIVDKGTDFTNRTETMSNHNSIELLISDVRLSDNKVLVCQVNGMAAGNAEVKTRLQVFGEMCKNTQISFRAVLSHISPISSQKTHNI